nr:TrfB-related DNA-binding protein [uncultured Roseateles sp.]
MKRLTEQQFQAALTRANVGPQTADIARGVLVEGKPQAEFVTRLGLSKGAVSQAVNRVWKAHEQEPAAGMVKVTAVLPAHQAYQVKKWARQAKGKA